MTQTDTADLKEILDQVLADDSQAEPEASTSTGDALKTRLLKKAKPTFIAGAPIVGFTGPNGAGKTLVAVSCVIQDDLRVGRPVYSTVQIDHPYGSSIPLVSLRQLLELRDCTVLIDEIAAIFSSRDSLQVPKEFDVFLQTLRHRGVTLRWTAPAWARADVRVREITQVAVSISILGKRLGRGEFWPTPLSIFVGALDATGVAVDTAPEKVSKRRVLIPQALQGWGAYDTLADTPRLGAAPHSGSCVDCGGSVPRPACSADRHQELGLEIDTAAPARRPASRARFV